MAERLNNLILFDPMCNLCAWIVNYILRHDKQNLFRFGSLFSKRGKEMKKSLSWSEQKNTIIYLENDMVYTQSDAAIRIITSLPGWHRSLIVLTIFPKKFRDWFYKLIAKYRYRLFGKRKRPFSPDPKLKDKFIDYNELTSQAPQSN